MIQRGKLTDKELEKNLLDTQKDLYSGRLGIGLLKTLKDSFPAEKCAYVLQWIPEQGEDIFWILAKPSIVCVIEVPRSSNAFLSESNIKIISLDDYLKKRLMPETKRKVGLAVKLQSQQITS